jgi:hypothetical protein
VLGVDSALVALYQTLNTKHPTLFFNGSTILELASGCQEKAVIPHEAMTAQCFLGVLGGVQPPLPGGSIDTYSGRRDHPYEGNQAASTSFDVFILSSPWALIQEGLSPQEPIEDAFLLWSRLREPKMPADGRLDLFFGDIAALRHQLISNHDGRGQGQP